MERREFEDRSAKTGGSGTPLVVDLSKDRRPDPRLLRELTSGGGRKGLPGLDPPAGNLPVSGERVLLGSAKNENGRVCDHPDIHDLYRPRARHGVGPGMEVLDGFGRGVDLW
jgi:hypothetical protein